MNADEIVRALRKAQEDYKNDIVSTGRIRIDAMARDCADLIESLQAQLADEKITSQSLRNAANGYKAQLAAEKRRADAAVEDIAMAHKHGLCEVCGRMPHCLMSLNHGCGAEEGTVCDGDKFEWRGVKEERK